MAAVAETFIFIYLGLSAAVFSVNSSPPTPSTSSPSGSRFSLPLVLFTILLCLLSRALHVFPLSYIANWGRSVKIPFNLQVVIWFAPSIRGAVAFGLWPCF